MLLICPVRPGDSNEELRYAIRSWETNLHLGGTLELMTVGYKPTWLEPDYHVEGNKFSSMPQAVFDNIRLGADASWEMGYDDVVYMNDDFFCLDPTGAILPVRRDVSLERQVGTYPGNAGLWWPKSLRLTLDWLAGEGFPHPHSYEVHRPLPAKPDKMLSALDRWGPADKETSVPQWRTIYGVLNKIEAHPVKDVKLSPRINGVGSPWVSTSDETWRRFASSIKKRFPETSHWEK